MKNVLTLFLLIFSFTQAQECKTLLKTLYPISSKQIIKTITVKTLTEFSFDDSYQLMSSITIIDKQNHRLYYKTTADNETLITIYQNNELRLGIQLSDGSFQSLPELQETKVLLISQYKSYFERANPYKDFELISCDGRAAIQDLINGEQITVLSKTPKLQSGKESTNSSIEWQEQEMKIIFDSTKGLFAMLTTNPSSYGVLTLTSYKPVKNSATITLNTNNYQIIDGNFKLFSHTVKTSGKINKPIDESLFNIDIK